MVDVATDAPPIAEQTDTSHWLEMQRRCALTGECSLRSFAPE